MRDISIAIDEIVLNGVSVPDEGGFRASLIAELTTLALGHTGAISGGAAPELHGTALSDVDNLGAQVAQSVWSSMVAQGDQRGTP
ncbi:hypothetical protein Rhe02_49320 [Rhizocola hellebori]|uniref:Uncharacterized protein n=1 Tax=Rhizocola hellebori TaxID=1392758 RepID=A0A8J3VHU4_9ACTN|nr:hypothetical protein [Rhizocola hellebori]GIH06865.1 hypothetical protein Rhe02_49320 [Rhizocola hellebori]